MNNRLPALHNFWRSIFFRTRVILLVAKRYLQNLNSGITKFQLTGKDDLWPVIATSVSDLWNLADNEQNWILTAGKVQNLRIASGMISGIEIPAGQIFSFWKYIGNPNVGKGFVIGREIREGCVVPTRAGGLCQLSNALYDAAVKAGFEILERHKHTRVITGSLAEQDRDATVKWNYVDLRFRSNRSFRIETELTGRQLIVKICAFGDETCQPIEAISAVYRPAHRLNDCYSCGNLQCFKHPGEIKLHNPGGITAFVLDEFWPEHDRYIQSLAGEKDHFIVPAYQSLFKKINSKWNIKTHNSRSSVFPAALKRIIKLKRAGKKENIFSLKLSADKEVAKAMVKKIPIEATHLVISQNLLPWMFEFGATGGRTFDVLMTRLPMEHLHQQLDAAYARYPESETLSDFRAPRKLIGFENAALTRASRIVTPHHHIVEIFSYKSVKLDWIYPDVPHAINTSCKKILFPASALGRKGAYEVRQLARELSLTIVVTGIAIENPGFWDGIDIHFAKGNIFKDIGLVVLPAFVEHRPALLLKAIASGLPVVVSDACGLTRAKHVDVVPAGDYSAFKNAVQHVLTGQQESIGMVKI